MRAWTWLWVMGWTLLATISTAVAEEPNWAEVESMQVSRTRHTATLLQDGKVLVAGGRNNEYLKSAELFDPATGEWSVTGSMNIKRADHTATLLPSGDVLVVGGNTESGQAIGSVEIYEPQTGTWSPVAPISPRVAHTATLLHSGKVLIVGGTDGTVGSHVTAVEIYDPDAEAWYAMKPLVQARARHTATILENGDVLVIGGSFSGSLSCVERYNPSKNHWIRYENVLVEARHVHTATRLPSGHILVAGGLKTGNGTTIAEVVNPATHQSQHVGDLPTPRRNATSALLPSGHVMVAGGGPRSIHDPALNASELYDPATQTWSTHYQLRHARTQHAMTLLPNGDLLVTGGRDQFNDRSSAELFPSSTLFASWMPTGNLHVARESHTTSLLPDGRILVAGGRNVTETPLGSVESYDPEAGTWNEEPGLTTPRYQHTATLLQSGDLLIAGGRGGDGLLDAQVFDPDTDLWSPAGITQERGFATATLLSSGRVLLVGGLLDTPLSSVEIFDPANPESWAPGAPLIQARGHHTATLLPNGDVLVVGGWDGTNGLSSAEIYHPDADSWSSAGQTSGILDHHAATLLPSGKVLAVGGVHSVDRLRAEIYDPTTNQWRSASRGPISIFDNRMVLLPNGQALLAGGVTNELDTNVAEIFNPLSQTWSSTGSMRDPRSYHGLTVMASGQVLAVGGSLDNPLATNEIYGAPRADVRAPIVQSVQSDDLQPNTIGFGSRFHITGQFRAHSETLGGELSSPTVHPLFLLRQVNGPEQARLVPDPRPEGSNYWDEPTTYSFSHLPSKLNAGFYNLFVTVAGITSHGFPVEVTCGHQLIQSIEVEPQGPIPLGQSLTLSATTQGARRFQWQRNGLDIPGANDATYVTPAATAGDDGNIYSLKVRSGCAEASSEPILLRIDDTEPPEADLIDPTGGERWPLSTPEEPSVQTISWTMSDNVRICQVDVELLYSLDDGLTFVNAPPGGGLPQTLGEGEDCAQPVEQATLDYTVPTSFPAGDEDALYKVRLRVADQRGNVTVQESPNPFFIIDPNTQFQTLILTHFGRLATHSDATAEELADLDAALRTLATHDRVQGLIVNLEEIGDIEALYNAWDGAEDRGESVQRANQVLFGCQAPFPLSCELNEQGQYIAREGIHDLVRRIIGLFPSIQHLVLVGGDDILPMARLRDGATLLPESHYIDTGELTDLTSVGKALASDTFLSDDPLANLDPTHTNDLNTNLFTPDLAVGRLVETPSEILKTMSVFLARDGVLDLSELDPVDGHKVQCTGYDFLSDVANKIGRRWWKALDAPQTAESLSPLDRALIGQDWDETDLTEHLCGNDGPSYGIINLNGHATHYQEGIPGPEIFDIQGVLTSDIGSPDFCGPNQSLDLYGSVIYSVGCHGGLPVAGSDPDDSDRSLDIAQSFLGRGAVVYIGNSGYGWGLRHGIGYSERLVEIFSGYLSRAAADLDIGTAVIRTKIEYGRTALDAYDDKTVMQWTVFGLPMYAVRLQGNGAYGDTGFPEDDGPPHFVESTPPSLADLSLEEPLLSGILVQRQAYGHGTTSENDAPPPFMTVLDLGIDLSADGVYRKFDANGQPVEPPVGCPTPDAGCYYAVNGEYDYSTTIPGLPIEPFFRYDSRLEGTSQHGVLWLGGNYTEEEPWHPMYAQLISNGNTSGDLGSLPRKIRILPTTSQSTPGPDPQACRHADSELNSLSFPVGERVCDATSCPSGVAHRLYEQIRLEVLYFNNTVNSHENCDRTGPELSPGFADDAYHQIDGTRVEWAVEVTDEEADIWRVVVVHDLEQGRWEPLELTRQADGMWGGTLHMPSGGPLTYVLQAVDTRGNVTWLEWFPEDDPFSFDEDGLKPHLADTVDLVVDAREVDLAIEISNDGDRFDASTALTYTLTLTNHGPEAVQGASVHVALPDTLVNPIPADGLWTDLSLEPGESQPLTLTATLAPNTQGDLIVTAEVLLPEGFIDPDPSNNSATDIDLVEIGPPTLQVTKTADPAQLTWPGGEVEMTVTVTNTSDVNDPVELQTLNDDVRGNLDGEGDCDPPVVIAPGAVYSCTYTVWIEGDAGSMHPSTVTAHGTDDEGVDAQGSGTTSVHILPAQADLDILKTRNHPDTVSPGDSVVYLITITNHGPDAVSGVDIVDTLPPILENPFPPEAQWLDLSLDAGQSQAFQLTGTVATNANGTLSNTVEVVLPAGIVDPDLTNNLATDSTDLMDGPPSITIDLSATPTEVEAPEGEVTFTVTITNTSEASDFVILYSLEDDLQGDLGGAGECVLPVHIAPGDSYTCSYGASISGSAEDEVTVTVTAQGVDEENDPAEGSASTTVQMIDTQGPQLVYVSSVSDTGDGRLDADETTQATLTQLHLHFSEALDVDTAEDTSGYRLIEAGADRALQTEDCAALGGDDVAYAVDLAQALADETTVALWVHGGAPLPHGLYRLWACDTLTDIHGNGLTLRSLDFSVTAEHQLQASNFDDAARLDTWLVLADPPAFVTFNDDDAGQATTSGAAQLSNPGGAAEVAISQCVEVGWPHVLELGGQTRVNASSPDAPALFATVDLFPTTNCNGDAVGGSSLPLHVGPSDDDWLALASGKVILPADTLSVRVTFSAQSDAEGFDVWLDDLYTKLAPLHGDGFESGDTSAWSSTVP